MSEHESPREARDRTLVLLCSDRCSALVFEAWDMDTPNVEWFAEVFKRPGTPSFRWRAKSALGLLFGKEPVVDDLCFGPDEITTLRDFLNECYPVGE